MKVLALLKKDFQEYGYGRKKWWAERLNIPPLMISHWRAGRQYPSGQHVEAIFDIFEHLEADKYLPLWANHLYEIYFSHLKVDENILKEIIYQILKAETIEPRTLALASLFVEKYKLEFEPTEDRLINRLGWLLESANIKPHFKPTLKKTEFFVKVDLPLDSKTLHAYLKKQQTKQGKRWHLFDASITQIKESFIW